MTAMDFPPNPAHPAAPAIGEKWPASPVPNKPVYTWDGFKWSTLDNALNDVVGPSATVPLMSAGDGATGSEANWSRGDHVHPAKVATPAAGDDSTSIATTAFVKASIAAWPTGPSQPIPTSEAFAVGTFAMLVVDLSYGVANGSTVSGTILSQLIWLPASGGYIVQRDVTGPRPPGTWKNVSGSPLGEIAGTQGNIGYFVRTA